MAETYWDPANLLQIADSYAALDIQCVGHAKSRHNARCRGFMSGADASAVLAKVKKLAAIPPGKVTQQELEELAKLCLCRDYHFSQWYQVAQRWKPTLAMAVKHHERLVKGSPAPDKQLENLLQERRKCFEVIGVNEDDADLPTKLSAHLRGKANARPSSDATVSQLQSDLAAARATLSASEERVREVEDELHRGKLKETELSGERLAATWRIEESRKSERTRLAEMLAMLETANSDRGRLEAMVNVLKDDLENVNRSLDDEKTKTTELQEANDALERRLTEATKTTTRADRLLGEEKAKASRARALEKEKQDLERRLSKANAEATSTRSLLEEEKAKTDTFQAKQEDFERRLVEAYTLGDQLLADERIKARKLKEANSALEHRVHELNVSSERVWHEEQTKARVISDIKDELKNRLSEVRALGAAELEMAKRDKETVVKERAAAITQARRAQADLEKAKSSHERLKDQCTVLERELQQSRVTFHGLQSANKSLTADNIALKHQLSTHEGALSKRWRSRLRTFVHRLHPTDTNTLPDTDSDRHPNIPLKPTTTA
jgi:chromosome segregation ATPase